MKNQYTKRKIGGYMVENITMVKGTDGPTAVFLAGKNHRYTLRQKIKKYIFNRKMKFVEKSLKPEGHTVDEVIYYVKINTDLKRLIKILTSIKKSIIRCVRLL